MSLKWLALFATCALWSVCRSALAQVVADPGFESYSLAAGDYLIPSSGPWLFNNNAGVVKPFSPPTSTAPLNTWSGTFAAFEGAQYASAYAGADWFDQSVSFPAPGDYLLSVYAASPGGTVVLNGGTHQLTTGDFRFAVGGVVRGPTFTPLLDSDWARYSTVVSIPAAGSRLVGFHTTKTDSYFINFDAFSVTPVPEPSGMALVCCVAAAGLAVCRCR